MARKDISDLTVCKAFAERMKQIEARLDFGLPSEGVVDLLHKWTGEPRKVCYRAMERALAHKLVDYGTCLAWGFLTPKGEALVQDEINEDIVDQKWRALEMDADHDAGLGI